MENEKQLSFGIKDILTLLFPVMLGLLAWGLWIYEIVEVIGWKSLQWLKVPMYSVYPIIGLVVMSYLLPIIIWNKISWWRILLVAVLLYFTACFGFFAAKNIFYSHYSMMATGNHLLHVWSLFGVLLLVSAVFFLLKQFILFKSHYFHIMTLMVVFLSVIPASLGTVEFYKGWGNADNFIDAIKMGYPVFWVCVLLGGIAYLMVKKLI